MSMLKKAKLIVEMYSFIHNAPINISIKKIDDGKIVSNIYSTKIISKEIKVHVNQNIELMKTLNEKKGVVFSKNQLLKSIKYYKDGYSSALVLPIKKDKEIIGFLCLDSDKNNAFTKDIVNVLEPLLDTITKFMCIMLQK